ncbi:hypothetical protein AK830_g11651 [Neonectria ditissima]|uniref:ribonuclease H n=1 Tax=Neonectria ditissima TaxID=78410 RepID=A0A0P7B2B7_9HYPO|nr:hypothetical protein AK830_g11651 [Neonectria ditissima]
MQPDSGNGGGPFELPDGRLICPHGMVVCEYCRVDYSFLNAVLEEEAGLHRQQNLARPSTPNSDLDATSTLDIRRGTGNVLPTQFAPPSATSLPCHLFPGSLMMSLQACPPVTRFMRRDDQTQFLIYTDGSCLGNGHTAPKAGWAFVFKPGTTGGVVSGRLERKGPFGDVHDQTSDRAELRAVLAALRFRHWPAEGFTTLVLATDSEYVARGATEWVRGWVRSGWRTSTGDAVENKDLWEMLLGEVEQFGSRGLGVEFWRIPRLMNEAADRAAKQAAVLRETPDNYTEVVGALV